MFMTIKNLRYQTDELKAIVDPVIQRNSYFAHPENLLLSIMTRAGKNRFESIRIDSLDRIDSNRFGGRIEWVVFDSVQFDYTIHLSDITMFGNWQPIL